MQYYEFAFIYQLVSAKRQQALGPGEEVVKPCQCLQEFGEAASMMQLLRMAGNDLICSTGAPETLGSAPEPKTERPAAPTPHWVCGKEQEDDATARLQTCLPAEQGLQFCPVDAVDCQKQEDAEDSPFTCPLGAAFACVNVNGKTIPQCSPYQCINLATTNNTDTEIIDGVTMANDGRRDVTGECLDQLYIFSGASAFCRPPGLQTAWKNCCKNQGKVVSDSSGAGNMKIAAPVATAVFKAGKAAYTAFIAITY